MPTKRADFLSRNLEFSEHRLSTIRTADKIVALKDGVAVESGTHDELMAQRGVYYTLNQLQFQEVGLDPEAAQ